MGQTTFNGAFVVCFLTKILISPFAFWLIFVRKYSKFKISLPLSSQTHFRRAIFDEIENAGGQMDWIICRLFLSRLNGTKRNLRTSLLIFFPISTENSFKTFKTSLNYPHFVGRMDWRGTKESNRKQNPFTNSLRFIMSNCLSFA